MSDIHTQIESWMAAALMKGLSEGEQRQFEQHLASCDACRELFKEEQMISTLLENNFAADRPGKRFEDRMVSNFRRRVTKKKAGDLGWFRRIVAFPFPRWSAVLVLLMVLLVLGGLLTPALSRARENARKNVVWQSLGAKTPLNQRVAQLESRLKSESESGMRGSGIKIAGYVDASDTSFIGGSLNEDNYAALAASAQSFRMSSLATDRVYGEEGSVKGLVALNVDGAKNVQTPQSLPDTLSKQSAPPPATGVPDDRKLVRNATLELEVIQFAAAVEKLTQVAHDEGGFVATSRSERGANGKMSGQVVLKIAPQNLDHALAKLREMGEVKNQELATQDVTKAYFDTDARLRNAQRMETRLLEMLDNAKGKVTDLLQVEKELARVREQIEQMQGELKLYDHLVQFATVTVTLLEKDLEEPAAFLLKESVRLSVASTDVEKTFQDAKHEAEDLKAQIVHANLNRQNADQISAVLRVVVAPENSDELIQCFKKLGHVQNLSSENQRVAQNGTGVSSDTATIKKDKVQIDLTLIDEGSPLQTTNLSILTKGVDEKVAQAKEIATQSGAEIRQSTFEHSPDGRETANLTFRLPISKSGALADSLKKFGKVKNYSVQRQERASEGAGLNDAPAEISLQLYSEGSMVSDESGVIATLKRTFTQGVEMLMWSVRTIGVAVAFLLPWVVVILLVWGAVRIIRRRK